MSGSSLKYLMFVILLSFGGCSKKETLSPNNNYSPHPWETDSMYDCNTFHIFKNEYYKFNDTDNFQFRFKGTDTLKFVRNHKDTFVFISLNKDTGKLKYPIIPCFYYFNYYDTSEIKFFCNNFLSPIIIRQRVIPSCGDCWFDHYPLVIHQIYISFKNTDFFTKSTFIQPGFHLEVSSTALLTYKVYLEQGVITKFILQGSETWDFIP